MGKREKFHYTQMTVRPLTGVIGAEISNIDLSKPLNDVASDEVKRALIDHLVVVFRDQHLSPDQYKDFAKILGPLDPVRYGSSFDDEGFLQVLDSDGYQQLKRTNFVLHIDESAEEIPNKYTLLLSMDLPETGGDTLFTNLYTAYETMTAPMRAFLGGLSSLHGRIARNEWDKIIADQDPELLAKRWSRYKDLVAHPLVCTHPESGRKLLYFNPNRSVSIPELSIEEGQIILDFLRAHCTKAEFGCRIQWRPNSLLIWDNRCTMHKVMTDFWSGRRRMLRIEIPDAVRPS